MKRVMVLLVTGTILSGIAAAYAATARETREVAQEDTGSRGGAIGAGVVLHD